MSGNAKQRRVRRRRELRISAAYDAEVTADLNAAGVRGEHQRGPSAGMTATEDDTIISTYTLDTSRGRMTVTEAIRR